MKTIYTKTISFLLIAAVMTSCSTSTKMTITGVPGSEIMTPNGYTIATIPAGGQLKTEISDDGYFGLLLTKNPQTGDVVPFALNTYSSGHHGTYFAKYLGLTLAAIGVAADVGSVIVLAADDESEGGKIAMLGGLALAGIGGSFGAPAHSRCDQTSYQYGFKYCTDQKTNSDLSFTKPEIRYFTPTASEPETKTPRLRPNQKKGAQTAVGEMNQKVSRKIKDDAKKVSGEYVGPGRILLGNEEMEALNGLTVRLERIDGKHIGLTLIEADGNDFFGTPIVFEVSKGAQKGSYKLTQDGLKSCEIMIDKNGILVYKNPRLEIDGTVYTLTIKAEKQ